MLLTRTVMEKALSTWSFVRPSPPDPILGLTVAFNKNTSPNKVNLGVGAYRDSNGKPYVLNSVKLAQSKLVGKDLEYTSIDGVPSFIEATQKLAFGNDRELISRTATVQSLSGTGSLRLAAEFLRHCKVELRNPTVYLSEPTWGNHSNILSHANLNHSSYAYYNKQTNCIDIDAMVDSIRGAKPNSVIMFHACAHNPTGMDPTMEQWTKLSRACKDKEHIVWFDSAYQGFASGDPVKDAQSYKLFINHGHNIILSQSYAKNMGLYGMRVGALSFVTSNETEKTNVLSKLKTIIRPIYSSPPIEGARIVSEIINSDELYNIWLADVKLMANRIMSMRSLLKTKLENIGSKKDWSHITKQIGMFCYTGLTKDQVDILINEHNIYLTSDGRISMAGINQHNIDYVVRSFHKVSQ